MTDHPKRIIEFYGRECPHCIRMIPVIAEAERVTGITVEKFEVWHDEQHAKLMQTYAGPLMAACGGALGVPAFMNEFTGEALCGEQDVETFIAWMGKKELSA